MNEFTLSLSSKDVNLPTAGGKGANLRTLIAAGFNVPGGFVVTTAAYEAFVAANDLLPLIVERSQQSRPEAPATFEAASEAIRQAFAAARMPSAVEESIVEAYGHMGEAVPVAVRSSATAEDLPEASFAGQQDTYLNVQGREGLLEAVVNCWSSLWTARAMAYRARQGIAPQDVSLAVIVQELVRAESAGVFFTLNPVSGAEDEVLINAAWGLGEALVAGRLNPDTFVVDKETGTVKQVDVGDKALMTAAAREGTVEQAVPAERRGQASLTEEQAVQLARLGSQIEAHFGAPQDVEWAVAQGQIYLLQSRPVTTVAPPEGVPGDDDWPPLPAAPLPFDRWTQADVGERWPEPVTPFTWSTAEPMINENMPESFAGLKHPALAEISWARREYGHVYLNEGALIHLFADGFGMPASMASSSLANPEYIRPEQDRWRWGTVLRRLPLLLKMTLVWEGHARRFRRDFEQIEAWVEGFMARDLSPLSDSDLWQEAQSLWLGRLMSYMTYHASITSVTTNGFGQVESLLERWLGRSDLLYDLTAGLRGVIAAEMVPALWEIARRVRQAGLQQVVLENEPAVALERLRQAPSADPVLEALGAFLQRHGHRCMSEAEWLYPRWIEAPEQVIETIAGYLRAAEEFDPQAAERKQREQWQKAMAQVRQELNPLQMAFFKWNVGRLRRYMRLRDNGQHYLVKLLLPMRHIYATLARRWAERGWLEDADDFFFLVLPEVEALLEAGDPQEVGLDLPAIVDRRRRAYDYWFSQPLPEVLDAAGQPLVSEEATRGSALSGVPASAGRVQGVARIVQAPGDAGRLQPGEILVTRATDPGWTPVFSLIGGLVLEMGGQLSHGAIVAREYGLPAVVNVSGAMQQIADGQVITVDGSMGTVSLDS